MEHDDLDKVLHYANLAADFVGDAGVRFMAQYWQNQEDQQEKSLALLGWITTVMAHGEKAGALFAFFVAAVAAEIPPDDLPEALREAFPDQPGRDRVKEKVTEYAKLLKMGEG